jgi:hypothetical protein
MRIRQNFRNRALPTLFLLLDRVSFITLWCVTLRDNTPYDLIKELLILNFQFSILNYQHASIRISLS